jgi:hypothetical protein
MLPSHEIQPLSEHQRHLSNAVRNQWRLFENWLAVSRSTGLARHEELCAHLDEQMATSKLGVPPQYHVLLREEFDAKKRDMKLKHDNLLLESAKKEWQQRLDAARLDPENWVDMTPAECLAVERALGGTHEIEHPPQSSPPSLPLFNNNATVRGPQIRSTSYSTNPTPFESNLESILSAGNVSLFSG